MNALTSGQLPLYAVMAALALSAALNLAWASRQARPTGPVVLTLNVVLISLLATMMTWLSLSEPGPASLRDVALAAWPGGVIVMAAFAFEVTRAAGAHTVGAGILADATIRWPGAWQQSRARRRLDRSLRAGVVPSDARLGLLYHRSVYTGLGVVAGSVTADEVRVHSDLDLARAVLPDVRLGWLAAAATAALAADAAAART